jgi:hypothetical protein
VKAHKPHVHTAPVVLAMVVLLAAHAALFGLAFGGHLSVGLVAGMLGLVALKVMWWKRRR